MASLFSPTEVTNMLSVFENSFDTWARTIVVYKEPLKVQVPNPNPSSNTFGFGDVQQDPMFTYITPKTGVFQGIIRDGDIESSTKQMAGVPLAPEVMARILASPVSLKVRPDAAQFIEDGVTERIVDIISQETYLPNGRGCLQTFQGSQYWIFPLRKTQ